MRQDETTKPGELASRRFGKWVFAGLGASLLAVATAFGTNLGSSVFEGISRSSSPPISYSAEEQGYECGSITYLPQRRVKTTLHAGPPTDWDAFQHQPGAVFAEKDVVQVSIQGESERTITLTRITFNVERHKPARGAVFAAPCGDSIYGRAVEVNLDANPPQIVASSSEAEGALGAEENGRPLTRPIRFPWTVSVTDPLLLYIVATTTSCHCRWSAEIPWVSGSQRGVMSIDNGGDGYEVISHLDTPGYLVSEEGWDPFRYGG